MKESMVLESQKREFIASVVAYKEKYQEIINQINEVNSKLDSSDDNLLYDFVRKENEKTIKKIQKLLSNVEKSKKLTIARIDARINELKIIEAQEEEDLLNDDINKVI